MVTEMQHEGPDLSPDLLKIKERRLVSTRRVHTAHVSRVAGNTRVFSEALYMREY